MVAFIVLDSANPFFTDVARGADLVARAEGCFLVTANTNGDHKNELAYLGQFASQRVHGVLIAAAGRVDGTLSSLRRQGIASVVVDGRIGPKFSSVSTDNTAGGGLALEHLLSLGRRRIAFVGGPSGLQQVQDRLNGARAVLRGHKISTSSMQVFHAENSSFQEGRALAATIFDAPRSNWPDAVFATNDLLALGMCSILFERSIRVPEDVALIGYDDIAAAASFVVPLSSIRQPSQLIGEVAARLLIDEARSTTGFKCEQLLFPPELVARKSTTGLA